VVRKERGAEGKERKVVTADRLSRARAGDGEAFGELAGSYRRELQVRCYRMLGSFADAEDAVQETMLAAWQGIGGFAEERGSLRTWLYTIATSRCLNARRAASRREHARYCGDGTR
jgi:RNA polymerase sigma-70 factor (ECF subfamily)